MILTWASVMTYAADAAQVVSESGAVLVGTPEHCDQVQAQALADYANASVRCTAAAPAGGAYGARTNLRLRPGLGLGRFRLAWHDTSGPNREDAPAVYDVLHRLPASSVEVASVQGFGQVTNGGRDFRLMVEALRPQVLVPGHHDNWLPGLSTRGELYRPYVVDELDRIPAGRRPVLHWVQDPEDYLEPLVWSVTDPRWRR